MQKALLLSCALFLLHQCYAQTRFGLKAGLNAATVATPDSYPDRDNKNWRMGLHAGTFIHVPLSRRLFVQPELLYSLKGYGVKATPYQSEGMVSLHYVTLPLLAGYAVSDHLSLMAGPELGYLLSASSKYDGGWGEGNAHSFKDFDFGVDLGASYKINELLSINLRYNHGLKELAEGYITDRYGQIAGYYKEAKTRSIQVGIHYLFTHK